MGPSFFPRVLATMCSRLSAGLTEKLGEFLEGSSWTSECSY
jgi:hypothetical protein